MNTRLSRPSLIGAGLLALWVAFHMFAIGYGTKQVPFATAYVGDEQSPVYGALQMIRDKSVLTIRDTPAVYYGPLLNLLAVPVVVGDFVIHRLNGSIHTSEEYRALITYDWGGLLYESRWLAVLAGVLGLLGAWQLFLEPAINPERRRLLPFFLTGLLATNFYYWKYTHFFRHWIFLVALLVWQIVFILRIERGGKKKDWIGAWACAVAGFGVSYVFLLYQVMWLPLLVRWVRARDLSRVKPFILYSLAILAGAGILTWWLPSSLNHIWVQVWSPGAGMAKTGAFFAYLSSFWYYLGILVFNQPFETIAIILLVAWGMLRHRLYGQTWFWMFVVTATAHLLALSTFGSVARYALPAIVLLLLCLGSVVCFLFEPLQTTKRMRMIVLVLFALGFVFQTATDVVWSREAARGPEAYALIDFLRNQQPENKILYVGDLLPAWHDRVSFERYLNDCITYPSKLYPYMLSLPGPKNIVPLHLDYACHGAPGQDVLAAHDTVITATGEPLEASGYYYDVRIIRLWSMNETGVRYHITGTK